MLSDFIKGIEIEELENRKVIESGKGITTHARWFGPSSFVWTDRMFDEEYCLMFFEVSGTICE